MEIELNEELTAKVQADQKKFDELAELVKPVQDFINKYYDSMCAIIVNTDRAEVIRREVGIITDDVDVED